MSGSGCHHTVLRALGSPSRSADPAVGRLGCVVQEVEDLLDHGLAGRKGPEILLREVIQRPCYVVDDERAAGTRKADGACAGCHLDMDTIALLEPTSREVICFLAAHSGLDRRRRQSNEGRGQPRTVGQLRITLGARGLHRHKSIRHARQQFQELAPRRCHGQGLQDRRTYPGRGTPWCPRDH